MIRLVWVAGLVFAMSSAGLADDPAGHARLDLAGWTVYLSDALRESDAAATETAIDLLRSQLEAVAKLIPTEPLARLRETRIWLSPTPARAGPTGE